MVNHRKYCGIYEIRNKITGKVYIGSSRDCARRFSEHRSRLVRGVHVNGRLQASWNKHGADAFEFLLVFSVIDADDLEAVEQTFLNERRAVDADYNLAPTAGNTAGWRAGPETRARMSAAAKKRDSSKQLAKALAAITGRKRPKEEVDRIWATRRRLGKDRPSDEAKHKMAKSARARSRYTESDRMQMVILRMEGFALSKIGELFGLSGSNVYTYTMQWIAENRGGVNPFPSRSNVENGIRRDIQDQK